MGEITLEKMSDEYFDVLKEIGNIGAGNATTALAQMMQCKVDMAVPQVKLLEFKELGEIMGGEELIMAGIYPLLRVFLDGLSECMKWTVSCIIIFIIFIIIYINEFYLFSATNFGNKNTIFFA